MRGPGGNTESASRLEQEYDTGQEYGIVGYTHAGGVDRPLVAYKTLGGNAGAVVVPHMNWRGLFSLGTNAVGGASTTPVEWPGFRTTAYHSMGETQQSTKNWMGSLLEGQRDAGGQMYMRNRYYDPATGQFTQTDPIGIAGGLNTYGFAAGDPVTYSDPYGLYIVCRTTTACDLWNRVYAQAYDATRSDDAAARTSGERLLTAMNALAESDERISIYAADENPFRRAADWVAPRRFPLNRARSCSRTNSAECPEAGGFGIRIDPGWSKGKRIDGETRLVHEVGHVFGWLTGATGREENREQSVETENDYRTIRGCRSRGSHATSGPPCRE